ncbi:MAG TPA: hypothetical protein VNZ52_12700 [Candidatus Thermoplasmatota archaeon]|nr:hypothetical protein [Candidatus Thermoplasmatota archaeon]
MMYDSFDYELVCGHCQADLGTFVQGDDFAEEPHACPHCASRHLVHHTPDGGESWGQWSERGPVAHLRFL